MKQGNLLHQQQPTKNRTNRTKTTHKGNYSFLKYISGLEKNLNPSLSFGQAALAFCLPRASSCSSQFVLPGPLPVYGQFAQNKSYVAQNFKSTRPKCWVMLRYVTWCYVTNASLKHLPGVRHPGIFMYNCTEFIPRMVWPIWLNMFPGLTT